MPPNRIYIGEAERNSVTEAEFEGCIKRICQGDQMGLKDIYVEYLPYIYRVVYGIVGNKESAEDITSDFFVKLWSFAPKYRPGNGHKGYLATIARNMAFDHLRRCRREIPMEDPEQVIYGMKSGTTAGDETDADRETDIVRETDAGTDHSAGGVGADNKVEKGVRKNRMDGSGNPGATPEEQVISDLSLKDALEKLKPEERRIIDMKVLGEMTFKEIAELLGIPMGTVTWRYQEGIKRLRRCGYE